MKEIDKLKDAVRFAENTTVTLKKLLEHFEGKESSEDKIERLFNEIENLTEEETQQLMKMKYKKLFKDIFGKESKWK